MPAGAYTPIFEMYKGNENITANFQNRALSIKVELASGNGSQDTCSIIIDDRDWLVATPQVDDVLTISLGYKEVGLAFIGTFEIDEVTFSFPPKQIMIHGNSEGFNSAFKSPQIKNYSGTTVGEILGKIAGDIGLSPIIDPKIAAEKIEYKNATTSPMHLVGELERRFNGVAKISQGKLSFSKRDSGTSASGAEIPLIVLRKEHFASCQVKHKNRSDYTKSVAQYKDKDSNKTIDVEAKSAVEGLLGQGGGTGDKPFTIKNLFPTKEEAQAAADSQMKALDRTLGEGLFTLAQGDPWIKDQNRILVIGTREGIDGSYVADIVTHEYTRDGALKTSMKTDGNGEGTSFAPLYEADPTKAIAPKPGQVTGEAMPLPTPPTPPATPTP